MQCTLYSVQCTLTYGARPTLYTVNCTPYTVSVCVNISTYTHHATSKLPHRKLVRGEEGERERDREREKKPVEIRAPINY